MDRIRNLGLISMALMAAAVATQCNSHRDSGSPESNLGDRGELRMGLAVAPEPGASVAAIRFVITNDDGTYTQTQVVPIADGPLPEVFDPDLAGHRYADYYTVLLPGDYTVVATPLDTDGNPSDVCGPATGSARVMPEITVELKLVSQCAGEGSGGLDTMVVLNNAPFIEELEIIRDKLICTDEAAVMNLKATDAESDPLTYSWRVVALPAGADATSYCLSAVEDSAAFGAVVEGRYDLAVEVTDGGGTARLVFPIFVSACDVVPDCPGTAVVAAVPSPPGVTSGRCQCEIVGPDPVGINISVHDAAGDHYTLEADVTLTDAEGNVIQLTRPEGTLLYTAEAVPGSYELQVTTAEGLTTPARTVEVTTIGISGSAYLGRPEWPFYRLGKNVVPFQSEAQRLAVVFERYAPQADTRENMVTAIEANLPLERLLLDANDPDSFLGADGAIWLFDLTVPSTPELRTQLATDIRALLNRPVRVGMPVRLRPGQLIVMDNRFVVRFRAHLRPDEIEALVAMEGATILRGFIQAENARLISFQSGSYQQHLQAIETWFANQLLVYGEPELMAEGTDDAFPADPPDDPTYGSQDNLTLQDVDDAWQMLNAVDANLTLGSTDVYVATIDRGVEIGHSDVGGNLTDGNPQISECFDFRDFQQCTDPSYAPDSTHGMGVYGIVAALTDNTTDIAGIAPNTHQIGIKRLTDLGSTNYADMLLWTAGFVTGNAETDWPAEPISEPADIISCSHGVSGLALSGLMDDTLTYLSTYGRDGRGTLVVYSAGNTSPCTDNDGTLITGYRVWAAHPRTLGISNSLQPDGGVEVLRCTSNWGPEIDICAQGHDAPSLSTSDGEQTFGGTSASAPTVAAAAALMLSVEPTLTWIELRDRLRNTAVEIDAAQTDPNGQWASGFSQWYGHGRLDVDDAIQSAIDFDPEDVNLVARDDLSDDGLSVPSPGSTFWHSPDIWARTADPATDGLPDPDYGDTPDHEDPIYGQDNWVRVRVKNVGDTASSDFFVRAYLTHFASAQFQYPTDYVPSNNPGDPIPSPLEQGTYLIGEQQVSSLAAGDVGIYDFVWDEDLVPPETVDGTDWHPCLLAEVSPHTGPEPSGVYVFDNTNLAQRNLGVVYPDEEDFGPLEMSGVIGHADNPSDLKRIIVERGDLPQSATIWVRFLDREVEAAVASRLQQSPDPLACDQDQDGAGVVIADQMSQWTVFKLAQGDKLLLDVPMVSGPMTPVVLGVEVPESTPSGVYELSLVEKEICGRVLGGFTQQLVVQ